MWDCKSRVKEPNFQESPFPPPPPPLFFIVTFLHNWGRLEKKDEKSKKSFKLLFSENKNVFFCIKKSCSGIYDDVFPYIRSTQNRGERKKVSFPFPSLQRISAAATDGTGR